MGVRISDEELEGKVVAGVDTHADTHWLCVLDGRGRVALSREFDATAEGCAELARAIGGAGGCAAVGVEGTCYRFEQYGGREFMQKTEIDHDAYCIIMAHIPILFEPQLSGYDFDLGIAGHVHGGIIVLPFIGGLYTAEEGFFPKFTAGKYTLNHGQTLIISGGLGDSKSFPPRINNTPELVVIDIGRY